MGIGVTGRVGHGEKKRVAVSIWVLYGWWFQICRLDQCTGDCPAWHCPPDSSIEDPILEVWGKQWLSHSFVVTPADKSDLFVANIRMPQQVQKALQSFSGIGGIYVDPKEENVKMPSSAYQVLWMPRSSHRDLVHIKQVTPGVVGLARLGLKQGIRCEIAQAEAVHAAIRPGSSYLPQGRKLQFLIGPMPFGTLKSSVAQVLEMLPWAARPIQPVATADHVQGLMWRVPAVDAPPVTVIHTTEDHEDRRARQVLCSKAVSSRSIPEHFKCPMRKTKPQQVKLGNTTMSCKDPLGWCFGASRILTKHIVPFNESSNQSFFEGIWWWRWGSNHFWSSGCIKIHHNSIFCVLLIIRLDFWERTQFV